MKILKRLRLVNWHRFTNTTIDFEQSNLISGENGAGKSTLLDAIQFVMICSTNYFNKAAHENGKRDLSGYIRCKTGREIKPYERMGEISAHIALEFYEEKKDKYLPIGSVVILKGAKRKLMITGYIQIDLKKLDKVYDYSGCLFPEGIINTDKTEMRS